MKTGRLFAGVVARALLLGHVVKGHRKSSQKPSETIKIRFFFGGGGGLQKSHHSLQMVFCIDTGLRVEAWSATFVRLGEGEGFEWN